MNSECGADGHLGAGGPGLTMLPREDLEGLIGNRLIYYGLCEGGPWPGPVTRWIGGLGHELGHAFSLPHPPGCDAGTEGVCDRSALLAGGFGDYPDTYLRHDDKEALLRSPFLGRDSSHRPLSAGTDDTVAIRGTVTDPNGDVVVGIRVSAVADALWAWDQSAADGTFEIHLPAGSSGSVMLSVHAGAVDDCGWIGYHGAGGITTFREQATHFELGEAASTPIDIVLPALADELCNRQVTISGTVLDSQGEVAEIRVDALGVADWTEADGVFELRPPRDAPGSTLLQVGTRICGHIGYYGPSGFTARLDDGTRLQVGRADITGIEIRLPATPQQMCDRQILISGSIVGPDGEPLEGITIVSDPSYRWGASKSDGSFVLRLLEGTTGLNIITLRAGCGLVGYYGPDGFTTDRDDATGIEVGEGNVTGIEIRFPSAPDELCGG